VVEYNFRTKPYPYQLKIFEDKKSSPFAALFLEMGLGKSKIAVDLMSWHYQQGSIRNVIIVCHNTVLSEWQNSQIPTHAWSPSRIRTHRYNAQGKPQELANFCSWNTDLLKVLLINKEAFTGTRMNPLGNLAKLIASGPTMLIADESTFLKNYKSLRSKTWRKIRSYCEFCYIMTGTPEPNSPEDWFGQLAMLDQRILGVNSLTKFKNVYCDVEKVYGTGQTFAPTRTVDFKDREAFYDKISPFTIRLKKDDVLKDLPPKRYQKLYVDLDTEAQKAYTSIKANAHATLMAEAKTKGHVTVTSALTQMVRLQTVSSGFVKNDEGEIHRFSNAKAEVLGDIVADGAPTIVWCRFRETVSRLAELYPQAVVLWGGLKQEEVTKAINAFRNGASNMLIATTEAASTGLTFVNCSRNVYFENSFSYEQRAQSEDRTHRIGSTAASVDYIDLIGCVGGKPTVDEYVVQVLERKGSVLNSMPSMSLADLEQVFDNG
jgi:hypothetical protein